VGVPTSLTPLRRCGTRSVCFLTASSRGPCSPVLLWLPDLAYEKFWATVATPTDNAISAADFVNKTRPNTNRNVRPAGVRIIKVPLGEEVEAVKRKKSLFDPKSGPVPAWDNEWRQEEDKHLRAPTMTGIMNGVYYHRNTHNAFSRCGCGFSYTGTCRVTRAARMTTRATIDCYSVLQDTSPRVGHAPKDPSGDSRHRGQVLRRR